MSQRQLRAARVCKSFGRQRALVDVTLSFASGEIASVVGPNGAGKTTLLGVLSTLVKPSSGQILLGEAHPHPLPERLGRPLAHRDAIGERREVLAEHVGVDRHEPQLVDGLGLEHVERDQLVRGVRRVEAAAEQRYRSSRPSPHSYNRNSARSSAKSPSSRGQRAVSSSSVLPASIPSRIAVDPVSRSIAGILSTNS